MLELAAPAEDIARQPSDVVVDCSLSIRHEAGNIPSANIHTNIYTSLNVFTLDLTRSFLHRELGKFLQSNRTPLRVDDPDRANLLDVIPPRLRQTNLQPMPDLTLEHCTDHGAAKRRDG